MAAVSSMLALAPGLRVATRRTPSLMAPRLTLARAFSSLPSLRPTAGRCAGTVFRDARPTLLRCAANPHQPQAAAADLVPKTAVTSNAAALGQIRCGPRATVARTSRLKRARTHGFLARIRTANGRKLLARRRAKGRKKLGG